MLDIMDFVEVEVPPAFTCGEIELSAALILECQD
jgi:hypothetical protein